jgi:hypothetical protein
LYLSNDEDDNFLWQMPSVIIRAGVTVQVRINSKNNSGLKRMQANFDLAVGESLRLTDARGKVLSTEH